MVGLMSGLKTGPKILPVLVGKSEPYRALTMLAKGLASVNEVLLARRVLPSSPPYFPGSCRDSVRRRESEREPRDSMVTGRTIAESDLGALFVVFAKHDIEQVPRGDDARALPGRRKMLEIARYQIFGTRRLRTFEKHVVVRVRAYVQPRGWTDPESLFAIRAKGAGYDFFRSSEPRTADDLFIFRVDTGANAQLKRAAKDEHENLRGGPNGLQQGGDDDISVENDPAHEPGCGGTSRRAFRAAAISASISSPESWSRPACRELSQDF